MDDGFQAFAFRNEYAAEGNGEKKEFEILVGRGAEHKYKESLGFAKVEFTRSTSEARSVAWEPLEAGEEPPMEVEMVPL